MAEPLVHLIDDDDAIRASLGFVLEVNDLPARTYASPLDFLNIVGAIKSGCIVTDVRMPQMSGLELVTKLRDQGVALPVVVITGHGDVAMAVEAMRAGVFDFLEKPFDDQALLRSVRGALESQGKADRHMADRERFNQMYASLSPREREVLGGVITGKMNKVIAYELGISPRTVEVYRANVMSKTQAHNLSELVRMAVLAGYDV
ncbi:response regulator FixJ [Phenylobacterium immobile]|uniref:response regulator FixJ n=1 Tax=Phenylobacterium immobile TaxID=21 RepID=UPI000B320970|nr:response regulator FixJ [Phenylobacterium immobile]